MNYFQEDIMSEFINAVREMADGGLNGVSDAVILAMSVVCGLLIIASVFALGVSICLAISYVRYNKKQNSCGRTGEEIARTILDRNGLQKIKAVRYATTNTITTTEMPKVKRFTFGRSSIRTNIRQATTTTIPISLCT